MARGAFVLTIEILIFVALIEFSHSFLGSPYISTNEHTGYSTTRYTRDMKLPQDLGSSISEEELPSDYLTRSQPVRSEATPWQRLKDRYKVRFSSFDHLIKSEVACIRSQFVTVEVSLGHFSAGWKVIHRVMTVCPEIEHPIRFHLLSKQKSSATCWSFSFSHIMSHPRHRMETLLSNSKTFRKFVLLVTTVIHRGLEKIESSIIASCLNVTLSNIMPARFNHHIPVLVGDYPFLEDASLQRQLLSYFVIRGAINSFTSTSGIVFFTSTAIAKHFRGFDKGISQYITHYPNLLRPRGFLPELKEGILSRFVTIDAFTITVTQQTPYPDRYPQLRIVDLNELPQTSPVGLNIHSHKLVSSPFFNLGAIRASIVLKKQYCQGHHKDGICYFPCFPKMWVQPCHSGRLDGLENKRLFFNHDQVSYPARYCHLQREEMGLVRYRNLCEYVLHFNISEPFAPTRSRIDGCFLIVGTGNAEQCSRLIRKRLIESELPSYGEASSIGFDSAAQVGRVLGPAEFISLDGTFLPFMLNAPLRSQFLQKSDYIIPLHYRKVRKDSRKSYPCFAIKLNKFVKLKDLLCNSSMLSTLYKTSPTLARGEYCLWMAFLVELLIGFGANNETVLHSNHNPYEIAGSFALGIETSYLFYRSVFELGASHWKPFRTKSEPLIQEMEV